MTVRVVNTHEAKSRLSELIREAADGVEIIVARNGQPVARIVPWRSERTVRHPGAWAGQVSYEGDIVGSDTEVTELFDDSTARPVP